MTPDAAQLIALEADLSVISIERGTRLLALDGSQPFLGEREDTAHPASALRDPFEVIGRAVTFDLPNAHCA